MVILDQILSYRKLSLPKTSWSPRSLGGLSSANNRAGAAFTVGPRNGDCLCMISIRLAGRPLKEKKVRAATVEREGRLSERIDLETKFSKCKNHSP